MQERGRITIETSRRDHLMEIRISDTGHGIPADMLDKVFQPNFSTRTEGMGLGLAIAKKAIEDLNGTIEVEASSSAGTTILIRLTVQ
jgi:signal transduction histidine kinase